MAIVAPAITVQTPDEYRSAIERLIPFATRVHVDISDGEFAPTQLLPVDQLYWPAEWQVDIHVMAKKPSTVLPQLLNLKPYTIILHAEADEDILPLLQQIKQVGTKAGVALLRPTVPKAFQPAIEVADHVLIFSGDLGHYGGKASMMQLEKIRLVHDIRPNIEIGWDGGASIENAFSLAQGGVNVINAGGAINRADDPAGVYKKMMDETNRQRVI